MQMIPHSVPHEPCTNPAVGKPKLTDEPQHAPTQRIPAYDLGDD